MKTKTGTRNLRVTKQGLRQSLSSSAFCIKTYHRQERKAVLLESEDPIVVHGQVAQTNGAQPDGFLAVPVEENSREFIAPSYTPYTSSYPSDIFVAALRGNTRVEFAFRNGTSQTVTLPALGTYGVSSQKDLTGTMVTANAPIAVYSGDVMAQVLRGDNYGNRLIENIPPMQYKARDYILPPVAGRAKGTGYIVRVLFPSGRGTVTIDGSEYTNRHGQDISISQNNIHSLSYSPDCFVYQYNKGYPADSSKWDPFLMRVLPVTQYANKLLWLTPKLPGSYRYRHFISIVAPTRHKDRVRLDGQVVSGSWSAISSGFSALRRENINAGPHVVDHPDPEVKLAAYTY